MNTQYKDRVFTSGSDSDPNEVVGSRKRRQNNQLNRTDSTKLSRFVSAGRHGHNEAIGVEGKEDCPQSSGALGLGFFRTFSKGILNGEGHVHHTENEDFLPTILGKGLVEGAEKREREVDVGSSGKGTKDIGLLLIEKMGYKGGGLGKHEQGILSPVVAELRPKNMGLGFTDYNDVTCPALQKQDMMPIPCPNQLPADHPLEMPWSERARKMSTHCFTAEELAKKKKQGFGDVEEVIDMRGPQIRVTNFSGLYMGKKEREYDVPRPKFKGNIKSLVDFAELDFLKFDEDFRKETERMVSAFQREKEKLQKEAHEEKKQIDVMEEITSVVDEIEDNVLVGGMGSTAES